ncbi:MAG: sodium:calcium antiporter [Bacillota bacterium]
MMLLFGQYAVLAIITIFATNRASHYIDELDNKTHISGALIGGVLLALVTSLPELITTLTSTLRLGNSGLAFGNVFGSNLFNLLVLATADLIFIKHLFFNRTDSGKRTSHSVLMMYLVFLLPVLLMRLGWLDMDTLGFSIGMSFSLVSLLIVLIYMLSIRSLNKEVLQPKDKTKVVHSLKTIITRFVIFSILIVVSGYFVTVVAEDLSNHLGMNASFGGALFLGAATSLPELTAVFTLFKIKSYDIAIGNVLGSNTFNILIIAIVDFVNGDTDIFAVLKDDALVFENLSLLLILGFINSIMVLVALVRKPPKNRALYALPSLVIITSYLVYLALSI